MVRPSRRRVGRSALQRTLPSKIASWRTQSSSHINGVPQEQARVDASTEIHRRGRQVLRAAIGTASQAGMEQPPSAMSWLQSDNIQFLREIAAHCAYVPACKFGLDYYKSWAFCASFASIALGAEGLPRCDCCAGWVVARACW